VALAAWLTVATVQPLVGQTYVVLVRGLAGEAGYADRFHEWATRLRSAALRLGVPDSQVIYLAEDPARDPGVIRGPATKEVLAQVVRGLAGRQDATVFLVLVGHGSDRGEPRYSLPGPDLTAGDLGELLSSLGAQRVVVVNATSASGGFLSALSGPRRVIVTATKSGFEQNFALFGGYFVEAFDGGDADLDKDQRVSVLEAFLYARGAVARAYQADRRLLTEHAMLDDNGDGVGAADPARDGKDGSYAATVFLAPSVVAAVAAADSIAAALEHRRAGLEERIGALRGRRESMPQEQYERELEALLVELAEVTRALRERTGGRPPR
jgi:hypothetical protein